MRRTLAALLLSAVATAAVAKDVKFERGTLSIGDSVDKMLKVAGTPHSVQPLPGMEGFQVYEFLTATRNIRFTVAHGRIVGVGVGRR